MVRTKPKRVNTALDPAIISRFKKERFVRQLSEDDFRDKIVRPLFLRQGFTDGRDLCGRDEEGKDTLFVDVNRLGVQQIYVVQTKRGNLNLSSKANQNTVTASTQLSTALATKVTLLTTKKKVLPDYGVLYASGKINNAARRYICEQVGDPRILFLDIDDIIPNIDKYYAELWWGIDADRFPYLKNLRDSLLESSDTITLSELGIDSTSASPICDDMYIPLYLHRIKSKIVKRSGQVSSIPELEQVPVQSVLRRPEKLIHIVGEAGTGKTTALRRFAFTIADKSLSDTQVTTIPVIIKSTEIASLTDTLLDLIGKITMDYHGSSKPCFTQEDLTSGNVLVLVDALDELPNVDRARVVELLKDFHSRYGNCKIVLTSRNYTSVMNMPELQGFTRFTITPINLKQAQNLLRRLAKGKSLATDQAGEVLRQLHEVHGMDLNPLLVTVFVATSDYARRDIPANITELFKKFTEMMLGRWDMKKGLSQQYQSIVKDFLLKCLAFEMHSNKDTAVPLSTCKAIFKRELAQRGYEADLETIFDEVVYRSGLFKVDGDYLSFRHILLQEFFAGRGVPSPSFFQGVVTDDWWKHSLVFYFGEHPDAHAELTDLIAKIHTYDGTRLYCAAVSIGLAIQACYLAKVSEKVESMSWVMESLARAEKGFLQDFQKENPEFPLSAFLTYYLYARDSVACEAIKNNTLRTTQQALTEPTEAQSDTLVFWYFVSLVQSGAITDAEHLIKKFRPSDSRLLLGLHLGSFLISNLKITSNTERKIAKRICDLLAPKIEHLRKQVLREMKSMLLEVRQGSIKALPSSERSVPKD